VRYLSICSGIEAASVAWIPLGWTPVAFAEIERFPNAVLAHHYRVPNWGNITKFQEWPDAVFDVLVGGTPCQSFSVAGLRKGLADPRGNLALTYLAIADRYRPDWLVWENVPGVRSVNEGRAFGSFLGGLEQLGYGFAYRSLDAQYFGLAQRRERVFVVGHLGGWGGATAVLFEPESLRGDSPPSRQAGERPAGTLASRSTGGGGLGTDFDLAGGLVDVAHSLRGESFDASEDGTGRGTPIISQPLLAKPHSSHRAGAETYVPDVVPQAMSAKWSKGSSGPADDEVANLVAFNGRQDPVSSAETVGALGALDAHGQSDTSNRQMGVRVGAAVRRLTPRECSRLQGFPDDYTAIPWRGKPAADCPDGPQYKALGNSMAVPVVRWIGQKIADVTALIDELGLEK
tara:strand:- start:1837 stop:3042 length:1206 start_codon:yes stop_codon:yes gene_type:complete